MNPFFEGFGINPLLLAAQVINFGLLLWVLQRYLYKPVLKILRERTAAIEKGLAQAKEIGQERQKISGERKQALATAKREAETVVAQAEKMGEKAKAEIVLQAEQAAQAITKAAQDEIARERQKAAQSVRQEAAELVVAAAEKVLKEKFDSAKDREFIKKAVEEAGV